jgi:DNA (cytosine-5)-methyltransferase 1
MEGTGYSRMPVDRRNGHAPSRTTGAKNVREQLSIFGRQNGHRATHRLTSVDLFCGAGGISEGLKEAGFDCLFANDLNKDACTTFALNHPYANVSESPIERVDARAIRKQLGLRTGELDCLAGGPPCQGFSINAPARFLEDPRNALFVHYLRFLDEFKPKTIFFENVPGILSFANGLIVSVLLDELVKRKYDINKKILFAAHYGVPQERWRLIILASRVGPAPDHPIPTHSAAARANFRGGRTLTFRPEFTRAYRPPSHTTVSDALDDLPPLASGGGAELMPYNRAPHSGFAEMMRTGSEAVYNHVAPRIAPINLERLKYIRPGGSWRDIPFELLPKGMKRARKSDHTRRYGRLSPDGLAGTVMTKMDPHWGPAFHHSQDRSLTVREAARLQSFPDRYRFLGSRVSQFEQVGNAVPVLMAHAIGKCLRSSLAPHVEYQPSVAGR